MPRSASRWGPLGWTLDSQSVLFVTEDTEGPEISQLALGGGAVRPFMRFPEHRRDVISDFDLRADGALLVGRGQWHALPLLIEDVP